ncbi:hypothetical protein GCM10028784_00780 [Myceligenerans cantabricum]
MAHPRRHRARPAARRPAGVVLALGELPARHGRLRPPDPRVPHRTHRRARPPALGHRDQTCFTIYRDHTDSSDGEVWRPVGMASVLIDDRYRTAEFFIYIGEPAERGRGTGTAATIMVLDWAFHLAALRCVHLSVIAQNTGAIRAYEKAGFRIVGTRRRTGSWLGQPADEVIMDAIPEDYTGPRLVEAAVLGRPCRTSPRQLVPRGAG